MEYKGLPIRVSVKAPSLRPGNLTPTTWTASCQLGTASSSVSPDDAVTQLKALIDKAKP